MAPTLEQVNTQAIEPYAQGTIEADAAIANAGDAFHAFMIRQTRESDLAMFADMAGQGEFASAQDVPFSINAQTAEDIARSLEAFRAALASLPASRRPA